LPALVGLFLVAGILFFFVWPLENRPRGHVMEVWWYNESFAKWTIPPRKFIVVTFTGDTASDRKKEEIGGLYVRGMLRNKDTVHGIDFHFGENSRYASFVAVLDIFNIEDAPNYAPSDDGIKVYYVAPKKESGNYPPIAPMPL